MHIGRSPEEQALAGEESGVSGKAKARIPIEIKVDREEDDQGDFFVAYVIREGHPHDFQTFGSRDRDEALGLAQMFAKQKRYPVVRVYDTSSADGDDEGVSGDGTEDVVRPKVMTAYREVAKRHRDVLAKLAK
jgi:hypothetical protein